MYLRRDGDDLAWANEGRSLALSLGLPHAYAYDNDRTCSLRSRKIISRPRNEESSFDVDRESNEPRDTQMILLVE